jgi:hypothetical protein
LIKAFFIATEIEPTLLSRVVRHCHLLASRYEFLVKEYTCQGFQVVLVTADENSRLATDDRLEFSLGQLDEKPLNWDRFLRIAIDADGLTIENDYAGTIPVFYSRRNKALVVSNIEPCVFLGSGSSLDDISYENLYGFLRYSHFLWDETVWTDIYQMLPDSRYHFSCRGDLVSTEYLETVKATDARIGLTDTQVAEEFYALNHGLVERALSDAPEIVLPLSSGYDSRIIFAVLANDRALSEKTRCFTYGSIGSIEVESSRRLCDLKGVAWDHVILPCEFLTRHYLKEVSDIFGASLHMHGMYQIEFYRKLKSDYQVPPTAHITSGFMTGVPAGQHNSLLQVTEPNEQLTDIMNRFPQSNSWSDEALEKLPAFSGKNYLEKAEERFRSAFDRFRGDLHQKTVMFDIWTRQRSFIGYYPRVFEWFCPVVSPHMCTEYANFFMSLGKDHLRNRRAVELMLLQHYPDIAKIGSNSNGLASLGSRLESGALIWSQVFGFLGLQNLLPKRYRNAPIEFDLKAVRHSGEEAFFPLFSNATEISRFNEIFGGSKTMAELYNMAAAGDPKAYARVVTLQAVALSNFLFTAP